MSSSVDIANRALTKLGQARVTDFTTDNTNAARLINSLWEIIRDAELRSHLWRFAITRTSLAALADAPEYDYTVQYQLPSDCLRLIEINGFQCNGLTDYITSNNSLYVIEGNRILTNLSAPLKIRYVKRETDTQQYTTDFVEVLACRIAAECAETLLNSSEKRKLAWDEYNMALKVALRSNSLEFPAVSIYDDSWINSRF